MGNGHVQVYFDAEIRISKEVMCSRQHVKPEHRRLENEIREFFRGWGLESVPADALVDIHEDPENHRKVFRHGAMSMRYRKPEPDERKTS